MSNHEHGTNYSRGWHKVGFGECSSRVACKEGKHAIDQNGVCKTCYMHMGRNQENINGAGI